jgi:hypothetical protein
MSRLLPIRFLILQLTLQRQLMRSRLLVNKLHRNPKLNPARRPLLIGQLRLDRSLLLPRQILKPRSILVNNESTCSVARTLNLMSVEERNKMIGTVLIVILVLALLGALPRWPHSRDWGYYPTGGLGLVIFIVIILLVLGRI